MKYPDVKLMVGLPVYGGYNAHFVPCLMQLVLNPPCHLKVVHNAGDSLVSRARNRIAAQFLASDATHLLFIDTDLIFSPEHVERLVSHGRPLIAGLYPKKQEELSWVCNTRPEFGAADEQGIQRILYAGTGFLCIAREVFEAIIRLHPELAYSADDGEQEGTYYDFFKTGVYVDPVEHKRRYLSEDWYFCQLALDSGFPCFADTHVVLKHVGEAVYPLAAATRQMVETEVEPAAQTDAEVATKMRGYEAHLRESGSRQRIKGKVVPKKRTEVRGPSAKKSARKRAA